MVSHSSSRKTHDSAAAYEISAPLRPGTVMLEQTRDWQLPWQWVTRLPGDYGTYIAGFATEGAARAYGRAQRWCA